jgi:hypothetical protein
MKIPVMAIIHTRMKTTWTFDNFPLLSLNDFVFIFFHMDNITIIEIISIPIRNVRILKLNDKLMKYRKLKMVSERYKERIILRRSLPARENIPLSS